MPVAFSISSHSLTSLSKPSHPADVPDQPMMSTSACERSSAAANMGARLNWARPDGERDIVVTGKHEKCAEMWWVDCWALKEVRRE